MLDIGWSELVLIGIVALIVVGPKDLPRMFHALGRVTAKARGMAREFQRAMDDAAKASGLDEVKKDLNEIKDATSARKLGIDALEDAASKFEKWDPKKAIKSGPANVPSAAAAAAASATPSAAASAAPGSATAALAEKKAADQAQARQRALELQAERTAAASKGFATKAAETAEAAPAQVTVAEVAPEAAPAKAPRKTKAKVADQSGAETAAAVDVAPKPARKPPVRKKKSDA